LTIAAALYFMEYNVADFPNGYICNRLALEKNFDTHEVLILGNSHAAAGADPAYFDRPGINLAYGSQCFYYDHALTERYIKRLPKLKAALIGVSYFSMEYSIFESPEAWRKHFYERFWEIPPPEKYRDQDFRRYSLASLYGYDESARHIYKKFFPDVKPLPQAGNSQDKVNMTVDLSDEGGKKRVAGHRAMCSQKNLAGNLELLNKLIELLKKNGAVPVIVTFPVHSSYSKHIDAQKYESMQKNIKELCGRHNIDYFNYMYDKRLLNEDFYNFDHLNPDGCKKFSKILNEEILKIKIKP